MKWNTSSKVALGVGLGILVVAIVLRFMDVARPILMLLHLVSLAVLVLAYVLRGKTR
jgi:hypothetical protein